MFKIKSDQDDQARQPMDLRYMKLLRSILSIVFSWPYHVFGVEYKEPLFRNTGTIVFEGAFVCISGIIYAKTNFKEVSFLEMGHTYLTIFMSITSGMYQKVHKICHIFATCMVTELCFGVILFNMTPVFNNYNKGMFGREKPDDERFEHTIYYVVPFIDQLRDLKAYILIALVNILFSLDCSMNFCGVDMALSIVVFHIWGHLKVLEHDLLSIPTPAEMREHQPTSSTEELRYTEEENKKVTSILKDVINHHMMIMDVMTSTSDAFGLTLCLYYIFHQVSGCMLLLECSEMDAKSLVRYGPLTITLFQFLIQISVIVELLGSQSEKLINAVYSVPWECMDTSNRKIVTFLLCNVQKPIRLKPLGMVSVGVQTMATILKTSFSYFMLLKTFT